MHLHPDTCPHAIIAPILCSSKALQAALDCSYAHSRHHHSMLLSIPVRQNAGRMQLAHVLGHSKTHRLRCCKSSRKQGPHCHDRRVVCALHACLTAEHDSVRHQCQPPCVASCRSHGRLCMHCRRRTRTAKYWMLLS